MKRVILHIGTTKTGSSALQFFFEKNTEQLKKGGILYYQPIHRYVPWNKPSNGNIFIALAFEMLGKELDPVVISNIKEEKEKIKEELPAHDTLIFSEETIWENAIYKDGFWDALYKCLLDIFGLDVDVKVIVYLRRQDEWSFSNWREDAKSYNAFRVMQFEEYAFYSSAGLLMDYASGLKDLEKVFGKRNVIVRRYDRNAFFGDSIYKDFLYACGINYEEDYSILSGTFNSSITLEAAEAAIVVRHGALVKDYDAVNLKMATVLFSRMYPANETVYPLSYDNRQRLIDAYGEGNDYISGEYFDGRAVFQELFEDYKPLPYNKERAYKNAHTLLKLSKLPYLNQLMIDRSLKSR